MVNWCNCTFNMVRWWPYIRKKWLSSSHLPLHFVCNGIKFGRIFWFKRRRPWTSTSTTDYPCPLTTTAANWPKDACPRLSPCALTTDGEPTPWDVFTTYRHLSVQISLDIGTFLPYFHRKRVLLVEVGFVWPPDEAQLATVGRGLETERWRWTVWM